jgi:hypothetical protein
VVVANIVAAVADVGVVVADVAYLAIVVVHDVDIVDAAAAIVNDVVGDVAACR